MEIKVLNQSGKSKSKIALPEVVFGQKFNEDLVHQLVTTYISNGHQNTKGQKNRSAVRGGGRKPWKQKEELEQEQLDHLYGEEEV